METEVERLDSIVYTKQLFQDYMQKDQANIRECIQGTTRIPAMYKA